MNQTTLHDYVFDYNYQKNKPLIDLIRTIVAIFIRRVQIFILIHEWDVWKIVVDDLSHGLDIECCHKTISEIESVFFQYVLKTCSDSDDVYEYLGWLSRRMMPGCDDYYASVILREKDVVPLKRKFIRYEFNEKKLEIDSRTGFYLSMILNQDQLQSEYVAKIRAFLNHQYKNNPDKLRDCLQMGFRRHAQEGMQAKDKESKLNAVARTWCRIVRLFDNDETSVIQIIGNKYDFTECKLRASQKLESTDSPTQRRGMKKQHRPDVIVEQIVRNKYQYEKVSRQRVVRAIKTGYHCQLPSNNVTDKSDEIKSHDHLSGTGIIFDWLVRIANMGENNSFGYIYKPESTVMSTEADVSQGIRGTGFLRGVADGIISELYQLNKTSDGPSVNGINVEQRKDKIEFYAGFGCDDTTLCTAYELLGKLFALFSENKVPLFGVLSPSTLTTLCWLAIKENKILSQNDKTDAIKTFYMNAPQVMNHIINDDEGGMEEVYKTKIVPVRHFYNGLVGQNIMFKKMLKQIYNVTDGQARTQVAFIDPITKAMQYTFSFGKVIDLKTDLLTRLITNGTAADSDEKIRAFIMILNNTEIEIVYNVITGSSMICSDYNKHICFHLMPDNENDSKPYHFSTCNYTAYERKALRLVL